MTGHTKEPWVVHLEKRAIVPIADAGKIIPIASGTPSLDAAHTIALFRDPDATMSEDETYANAFRLCECVNALAGIPDPAAFVAAARGMEAEPVDGLLAEADRLVAAWSVQDRAEIEDLALAALRRGMELALTEQVSK